MTWAYGTYWLTRQDTVTKATLVISWLGLLHNVERRLGASDATGSDGRSTPHVKDDYNLGTESYGVFHS